MSPYGLQILGSDIPCGGRFLQKTATARPSLGASPGESEHRVEGCFQMRNRLKKQQTQNEWFVGFRQMAEGFTEKASLWNCGFARGSWEKSVNPRSSSSLTGLTSLPATYEQEAGVSVPEINPLISVKACWQARGRENLFFSPILFSYLKTTLEFCISGSFKLCIFWAPLNLKFLSTFLGFGLRPSTEPWAPWNHYSNNR